MPINEELKDKITQYTDKIPDEKLLHELYTSQTHSDLAPIVDAYKQQGKSAGEILDLMMSAKSQDAAPARTTSEVVPGTVPTSQPSAVKRIPGVATTAGKYNPNRPVQGSPEELNAIPSPNKPMRGETQISSQSLGDARENQRRYQLDKIVKEQGGVASMAGGLLPAGNAPYVKDVITRQVPNAIKKTVGQFGRGAKAQAARAMGTDVLDPTVATAQKYYKEINPVSGKMAEQVQKVQEPLMSERNALVSAAEKAGKTIDRADVEDAIQATIADMTKKSPHSTGTIQQATDFLDTIRNTWPEKIGPEYAQELKTQLGREIKTWDASLVKDAQATGTVAAKKAAYPALNEALGKSTPNPARHGELNKEYSELADLFSAGKKNAARNQPAQLADQRTASLPARTRLTEQYVRRPAARLASKAEQFGKSQVPAPEGLYNTTEGATIAPKVGPSGPQSTGIASPRPELPAPEGETLRFPEGEIGFQARYNKAQPEYSAENVNPRTPKVGLQPSEVSKKPSNWQPAVEPARQNDTQLLKKMFGPSKNKEMPFPSASTQTTEPMLLQELFRKVGSGEGVNLSAEEKVMLSKAMKDVNIKVENALSGKPRPAVTEHPYEKILNAEERSKYMK